MRTGSTRQYLLRDWFVVAALCCGVPLTGCGGSDGGVAPTPIIVDYSGTWEGSHTVTSCRGFLDGELIVDDPSLEEFCQTIKARIPGALTLSITQDDAQVVGELIFDALRTVSVPMTGFVDASGTLSLSGRAKEGECEIFDRDCIEIAQWQTSLRRGSMTGSFRWIWILDVDATVEFTSTLEVGKVGSPS